MENRARKVIVQVEAELDDGSKYAHEFVFLAPKSFTMSGHFELKVEMEKP